MKKTEIQKATAKIEALQNQVKAIKANIVKDFLTGAYLIPEIAPRNFSTIDEVLAVLIEDHYNDGIDLVPWIEKNINAKSLFKGCEYFSKIENPTIEQGRALLGLDENVLALCKLYVWDLQRKEPEFNAVVTGRISCGSPLKGL